MSRTEVKVATDFKLIIPDDVYQKIHYWMVKTKNEVSGFGALEYEEKTNTFTVKDVKLLKQTVAPASTEIDPHAIGKMMYDMRDEPMGMKWHWHTHPNMGVFWSADDMEVIRSLGQQGWILASVFNEKGEIKTAYYTTSVVKGPFGEKQHDVFHDNLKTEVIRFLPKEFFEKLDEEYNATVKKEEPVSLYAGGWHGYGDYESPRKEVNGNTDKPAAEDTFIPSTLDERRWKPPINLDFDEYGFGELNGRYIYNPIYDQDLKTDEEKMSTIMMEMDSEEINFLRRIDADFAKLYNTILTHQASVTDAELPIVEV